MKKEELIPHLFRNEFRKIVAVLCGRFGFDQIETAEDIASDTFLIATQSWGVEGIPPNPVGWLYQVAKNKAMNYLKRNQFFQNNITSEILNHTPAYLEFDIDVSDQAIFDSQLQMMFAVCNPVISTEAQIGLALRILCGFGIEEIAQAFLTNKETINKRLYRAKEKLRSEQVQLAWPAEAEWESRLQPVLLTIYLLFNEGYYSSNQQESISKELCLEAIRLCSMLLEYPCTNFPEVNALMALMCFHFSRFAARTDSSGDFILYDNQDTSQWNSDFISKGGYFLQCAATGNRLSKFHLEAGIAYWHTQPQDNLGKWENILKLYDQLLNLEFSPIIALNRLYVVSKVYGKEEALRQLLQLPPTPLPIYHLLLGELYVDVNNSLALDNFNRAYHLTKNQKEKRAIQKKIDKILSTTN